MAVFEYQGYDTKGKRASGIIDADSPKTARFKMRQRGVLITQISSETSGKEIIRNPFGTLFNRITTKDIASFTRQLATLQSGGLTLTESLDALRNQTSNVRFQKVVTDIRESIIQGASLADSLANYPALFDGLYVNLVRAGEASGALGKTLDSLAVFFEGRLRQRTKLAGAMIYPAVMTVVGGSALIFLLTYVMPRVLVMFEDMSQALPLPTLILLSLSSFFTNWWPAILIGVLVVGVWLGWYLKTEAGVRAYDKAALWAPVFGNLVRTSAISRFARALSVLLAGGVTLVEALKVTSKVMGNKWLEDAINQAIVSITEGQTIAEPLRRSGLFPPVVTQMIDAGERSGALTQMLEKISDAYDFEVEVAVGTLTALVEPLLILVMGSVVMFIVMAILLPIFELSQMTF